MELDRRHAVVIAKHTTFAATMLFAGLFLGMDMVMTVAIEQSVNPMDPAPWVNKMDVLRLGAFALSIVGLVAMTAFQFFDRR